MNTFDSNRPHGPYNLDPALVSKKPELYDDAHKAMGLYVMGMEFGEFQDACIAAMPRPHYNVLHYAGWLDEIFLAEKAAAEVAAVESAPDIEGADELAEALAALGVTLTPTTAAALGMAAPQDGPEAGETARDVQLAALEMPQGLTEDEYTLRMYGVEPAADVDGAEEVTNYHVELIYNGGRFQVSNGLVSVWSDVYGGWLEITQDGPLAAEVRAHALDDIKPEPAPAEPAQIAPAAPAEPAHAAQSADYEMLRAATSAILMLSTKAEALLGQAAEMAAFAETLVSQAADIKAQIAALAGTTAPAPLRAAAHAVETPAAPSKSAPAAPSKPAPAAVAEPNNPDGLQFLTETSRAAYYTIKSIFYKNGARYTTAQLVKTTGLSIPQVERACKRLKLRKTNAQWHV